ncbi:hypothetical protein BH20ACI3_BH20ACI3_25850 [soil metagenome]
MKCELVYSTLPTYKWGKLFQRLGGGGFPEKLKARTRVRPVLYHAPSVFHSTRLRWLVMGAGDRRANDPIKD